jgi:DNA-binding transcriptional MocR family regulator
MIKPSPTFACDAAPSRARAAFVRPSNQVPFGVMLSMSRRLELLVWAREANAWLIEDDYGSEFRYVGRPVAALQGLDDGERTIYIGTFSKVLSPGLRLGCAVVPRSVLRSFVGARILIDRHRRRLTNLLQRNSSAREILQHICGAPVSPIEHSTTRS